MKKRVCIGFNNIVSVGTTLKGGLQECGYVTEFYSNEKTLHKFDYNENTTYHKIRIPRKKPFSYAYAIIKLLLLAAKYDYFIIVQLNGNLINHYRDIKILRYLGKKTMLILAGCDARIPDRVEHFKWNPCRDCSDEYKSLVQCDIGKKKKKLELAEKIFSIVASPEECAGYLSKPYKPFRFPIQTSMFSPVYPVVEDKLIILHAPSHHHVKGTRYIRECVQQLSLKYTNIEFVCIENAPKSEVLFHLTRAHLVIDQMLVGFYGMFTVEAMALGKPVVCYIRPDLWIELEEHCPIINANPDNLNTRLEELIEKKELLQDIGEKSRKYVEVNHDVINVSRNILTWFNESMPTS